MKLVTRRTARWLLAVIALTVIVGGCLLVSVLANVSWWYPFAQLVMFFGLGALLAAGVIGLLELVDRACADE